MFTFDRTENKQSENHFALATTLSKSITPRPEYDTLDGIPVFATYVNELVDNSVVSSLLYADDVKLSAHASNAMYKNVFFDASVK